MALGNSSALPLSAPQWTGPAFPDLGRFGGLGRGGDLAVGGCKSVPDERPKGNGKRNQRLLATRLVWKPTVAWISVKWAGDDLDGV